MATVDEISLMVPPLVAVDEVSLIGASGAPFLSTIIMYSSAPNIDLLVRFWQSLCLLCKGSVLNLGLLARVRRTYACIRQGFGSYDAVLL